MSASMDEFCEAQRLSATGDYLQAAAKLEKALQGRLGEQRIQALQDHCFALQMLGRFDRMLEVATALVKAAQRAKTEESDA